MSNDNLKNIYNALTSPHPETNNKPLFTKDEIGATPEDFAKIMANPDNAKNIYTALTSPIQALGNKPAFTAEEIGANADSFVSILGLEKKSPIGSVSTSGSKPSQDTKDVFLPYPIPGKNIQSNPFKPVSVKPTVADETKKIQLKRGKSDLELAIETIPQTLSTGLASMPRFFYDASAVVAKKVLETSGGIPSVVLPTYDQIRDMTRSDEPGAINSLDLLDSISKKSQLEGERLSQKISTNKEGYIDLIKNKDYSTFLHKTVNDLIISAPAMAAISASPTTAVAMFASAKNLDLVDNNSVPDDLKPVNAFITGLAEVILEGKIGGTAVLKNTIADAFKKGVGKEVLEKSIRDMVTDWAKKLYPTAKELTFAGVEELSTDLIQQFTSYFTGESDKIDIQQSLDAFVGGVSGAGALKVAGKAVGASAKKVKDLTIKKNLINEQIDNPNISTTTKQDLAEEAININKSISDEIDNSKTELDLLPDNKKKEAAGIIEEINNADKILDNPEVSDDIKKSMEAKKDELNSLIEDIITLNKKELSNKDLSKTKPSISEIAGESITMNIAGKNVTGRVYVDEGGKATLESNKVIYEIPENADYVEYSSPISVVDDSIEYNGQKFDDVRIETFNGTERAILVDSGKNGNKGSVKTITKPDIVEEIKYTLALKDLDIMSDEDAQQIIDEYETRTQKENVATSEEVSIGEVESTKENEALNQAVADIDLIEQIALEEIAQAENAAKLVEKKVGSKTNVYLVSKNEDGSYSATLNGRNVRRPEVLQELGTLFEEQTKAESKSLIKKLQEQTDALKAEVEEKLFGIKKEKEQDATQKSTEQQQKGGEQSNKPKRERIKAARNEAKVAKANRGDSNISGQKAEEITNINANFVRVSELYDATQEAKTPTEKTTANRKLNAFLNANPEVKYIFENMNELNKQLGDRMDKSKGCP